jgi:hypothetical protein
LSSHRKWRPADDRPDRVGLLEQQTTTREPDLVPVRHGRMMASPFTFYRGAAAIMAADLANTPLAGLDAQLCGDAHLSNFGVFASPERRMLFDLNDFDETLPGPFENDVKRMATSFTIAGRNNGFSPADAWAATIASVTAYREAMASFAQMSTMDIWYAHMDEDELMAGIRSLVTDTTKEAKEAKGKVRKQETRNKKEEKEFRSGPRRRQLRRIPVTACRRCPSSASRSTVGTGLSVSRRSWSRCGICLPPMVYPPMRPSMQSMSNSARTGRRCKTIGATCLSVSRLSMRPAR